MKPSCYPGPGVVLVYVAFGALRPGAEFWHEGRHQWWRRAWDPHRRQVAEFLPCPDARPAEIFPLDEGVWTMIENVGRGVGDLELESAARQALWRTDIAGPLTIYGRDERRTVSGQVRGRWTVVALPPEGPAPHHLTALFTALPEGYFEHERARGAESQEQAR